MVTRTRPACPLVTIGIPVFNGEQYLAEAIESALAQDYPSLEIIISDNASTDGTGAIALRYVERDPRVTYVRQEKHLGSVVHFTRVRDLGRGKYFTWLAHDDLLSDVRYVSTVVEYLELHPDVVACASGFYILSHELPGGMAAQDLPELSEDRPWEETRRDFFVWPQNASSYAIYSMFRSDALARTPMHQRRFRGKLTPAWWEMPFLSTLAGFGRIVALPMHLRTFRWVNTSAGWQTYQMAPAFDLFILGFWTKLLLLRVALKAPLPFLDRCGLVQITIENLFRANLRRPMDVPNLIAERHREYLQLRQTARERAALIRSLVSEIQQRRLQIQRSAHDDSQWGVLVREVQADDRNMEPDNGQFDLRFARFEGVRSSLWEFFQSTPQWQLSLCEDINRAVGELRTLCDGRVELVQRLHAYAASIDGLEHQASEQEREERRKAEHIVAEREREELQRKEQIIAELKATADERLRLLNEADEDARLARAVSEQLTIQLQEKLELIVDLAASADERLGLVNEASADATNARTVAEQLVAQLHEKDQLIASLAASADERLDLVNQANADATNARTVAEQLMAQLQEKDQLITTLTASADERLSLVREASADADHARADAGRARTAAERLMAQLQEKDQLIAALAASADERLGLVDEASADASNARGVAEQLVAQLQEKDQLISALAETADERLDLVNQANADADHARTVAEKLMAQLQEKDQLIMTLTASADERLRLLDETTTAATLEREATEALMAQLRDKERVIAHLTSAANERLQIAEQSYAEVEQARARVERLSTELYEKEQVIIGLKVAAAERLDLIERLSHEMAQNGQPTTPQQ